MDETDDVSRRLNIFSTAADMIMAERALGNGREATRALMVHPSAEGADPAIIFDMLWPEGN